MIEELSPPQREAVRSYVQFLLAREAETSGGKPEFAWAGALRDLREHYSSAELQHQIARWRVEGE
jgi:hypothetical protein